MNNDSLSQQLITIGDWIRYAATRFTEEKLFFGHGFETAWDEAVQLVLNCIFLPPNISPQVFNSRLLTHESQKIKETIERRILTRMPLAYLLKEAWFCGLTFYVDQRVLIPRSPIGEWLEKQFVPWIDPDGIHRILDIGTGSGCIAIIAALVFPEALVDAVDISKDALAVAKINVQDHHLEKRVKLQHSDCFSHLENKKYDLIISNPPYVSFQELENLPEEYHHEPRQALEAANEGLAIVKKILEEAKHFLNEEGILVVEVGYSKCVMEKYFSDLPLTWLDLAKGGEGVFLLTKKQLEEYNYRFSNI